MVINKFNFSSSSKEVKLLDINNISNIFLNYLENWDIKNCLDIIDKYIKNEVFYTFILINLKNKKIFIIYVIWINKKVHKNLDILNVIIDIRFEDLLKLNIIIDEKTMKYFNDNISDIFDWTINEPIPTVNTLYYIIYFSKIFRGDDDKIISLSSNKRDLLIIIKNDFHKFNKDELIVKLVKHSLFNEILLKVKVENEDLQMIFFTLIVCCFKNKFTYNELYLILYKILLINRENTLHPFYYSQCNLIVKIFIKKGLLSLNIIKSRDSKEYKRIYFLHVNKEVWCDLFNDIDFIKNKINIVSNSLEELRDINFITFENREYLKNLESIKVFIDKRYLDFLINVLFKDIDIYIKLNNLNNLNKKELENLIHVFNDHKKELIIFKSTLGNKDYLYFKLFNDWRGRLYVFNTPVNWQSYKYFKPLFILKRNKKNNTIIIDIYIKTFMQINNLYFNYNLRGLDNLLKIDYNFFIDNVSFIDEDIKWELLYIYYVKEYFCMITIDCINSGFQHFGCLLNKEKIKIITGMLNCDYIDKPNLYKNIFDNIYETLKNKEVYDIYTIKLSDNEIESTDYDFSLNSFLDIEDIEISSISKKEFKRKLKRVDISEKDLLDYLTKNINKLNTKKVYKKAIIVSIYGASNSTIIKYIKMELDTILGKNINHYKYANIIFKLLKPTILDVIGIDVIDVMKKLNELFSYSSHKLFKLPDGNIVDFKYYLNDEIHLKVDNKKITIKPDFKNTFDVKKINRSFCVNLIHSLDALLLNKLIKFAIYEGIIILPTHDRITIHSSGIDISRVYIYIAYVDLYHDKRTLLSILGSIEVLGGNDQIINYWTIILDFDEGIVDNTDVIPQLCSFSEKFTKY